jgi:hypothetical protein
MFHSAGYSPCGQARANGDAEMNPDFRPRPRIFFAMFILLAVMLSAAILLGMSAVPLFAAV